MPVNKPIVDAGPTVQRRHVLTQPIKSTVPFDPSASSPDYEGQLIYTTFFIYEVGENPGYGNNLTLAEIYVGVDINGTLTWVKASLNSYVNRHTGENFDPMYAGRGTLGS